MLVRVCVCVHVCVLCVCLCVNGCVFVCVCVWLCVLVGPQGGVVPLRGPRTVYKPTCGGSPCRCVTALLWRFTCGTRDWAPHSALHLHGYQWLLVVPRQNRLHPPYPCIHVKLRDSSMYGLVSAGCVLWVWSDPLLKHN